MQSYGDAQFFVVLVLSKETKEKSTLSTCTVIEKNDVNSMMSTCHAGLVSYVLPPRHPGLHHGECNPLADLGPPRGSPCLSSRPTPGLLGVLHQITWFYQLHQDVLE